LRDRPSVFSCGELTIEVVDERTIVLSDEEEGKMTFRIATR
jgi:hypothetical protein